MKELEGNPGKRALPKDEPKPDAAVPVMPEDLTDEAEACWRALVEPMHMAGLLTSIDGHALESYCRLYAHCRECWRLAEASGGALVLNAGKPEINPYLREARQTEAQLSKLRTELGLNATSRSRITTPAEKEEDLDGFLKFPSPSSPPAA